MLRMLSTLVRWSPLKIERTSSESMMFSMTCANSFLMIDLDFFDSEDASRFLFGLGDEWLISSDWDEVEWGSAAILIADVLLFLLHCFDQKSLNSSKVMERKLLLRLNFWVWMNSLKMTINPISKGSNFKVSLLVEVQLRFSRSEIPRESRSATFVILSFLRIDDRLPESFLRNRVLTM